MARRILCEKCGNRPQLTEEDVRAGFKCRALAGPARKPDDHSLTVVANGEQITEALQSLMCDSCGDAIKDGAPIVAVSVWRGEGVMALWELDFFDMVETPQGRMTRDAWKEANWTYVEGKEPK
jgi:hypothetical protein